MIEDVRAGRRDRPARAGASIELVASAACDALRDGEVAVVTLAAGAGSRWTQGAGVVKALHPFCKLGGRHRTFLEDAPGQEPPHRSRLAATPLPHVFTTSYLTHAPIDAFLARTRQLRLRRPAAALARPQRRPAPGADGARPALRLGGDAAADARRAAAEGARQPARRADRLGAQARARRATTPTTCRSSACTRSATGTRCPTCCATASLAQLLAERPQLKYLLLHNIDTLGADLDPALLGLHIESGACLTLRGHHPPARRSRRRPGPRRTAGCGWSKAWPCRARRTSST